jgi:hypothetical protein
MPDVPSLTRLLSNRALARFKRANDKNDKDIKKNKKNKDGKNGKNRTKSSPIVTRAAVELTWYCCWKL